MVIMANKDYTYAQVKAGTGSYRYESPSQYSAGVETMQRRLGALQCTRTSARYYTGAYDGLFGSGTRTAVEDFQSENSTMVGSVDGIAGKLTLTHLDIAYDDSANYNAYGEEVSTSYLNGSSISETSLLARLIYAENTTSLQAQRNIAHVVYNRKVATTGGFPNTYRGVAQQANQWTVITQGHINARKPPRTNTNWQNALSLAKKLVAGTNLPAALNSTLTKNQLYAKMDGTEPSNAKDIVRVGGTVFYNV